MANWWSEESDSEDDVYIPLVLKKSGRKSAKRVSEKTVSKEESKMRTTVKNSIPLSVTRRLSCYFCPHKFFKCERGKVKHVYNQHNLISRDIHRQTGKQTGCLRREIRLYAD
jgi:hypothetical protein